MLLIRLQGKPSSLVIASPEVEELAADVDDVSLVTANGGLCLGWYGFSLAESVRAGLLLRAIVAMCVNRTHEEVLQRSSEASVSIQAGRWVDQIVDASLVRPELCGCCVARCPTMLSGSVRSVMPDAQRLCIDLIVVASFDGVVMVLTRCRVVQKLRCDRELLVVVSCDSLMEKHGGLMCSCSCGFSFDGMGPLAQCRAVAVGGFAAMRLPWHRWCFVSVRTL